LKNPSREDAHTLRIKYPLLLICVILASAASTSAQAIQSVYTELGGDKCKTLEEDAESAGYLLQQCPGVAGYKILINSGDDRSDIMVVKPDGSKHELNFGQIGGGSFSTIGTKAEWRVKRQNGKPMPIALIIRFDLVENPSVPEKSTSFLIITKITAQQICRVDEVRPSPKANEEARRLADSSAARPCVKLL
jgi:hypothetical protein